MFDFIKGVGIILVLAIHSLPWDIQDHLIGSWLMSFLMPMFFITSGYFMKKKSLTNGLRDSAKYLLKPYLYAMMVILGIALIHRGFSGKWNEWLHTFLIPAVSVHSGADTRIGAMWFVFALFLSWCIFYITGYLTNERVRTIIIIALAVVGGITLPLELPFQLSQGFIGAFYLYCGYEIKKKKLFEKKLSLPMFIFLILLWFWAVLYGSMDLAFYDVKYGIFSIIGCLAGSFLIIRCFLYWNVYENSTINQIRTIGRHTMWILCIHAVEAAVVPWKVLFQFTGEYTWQRFLMQFILRSLFIAAGCIILKRVQARKKGEK